MYPNTFHIVPVPRICFHWCTRNAVAVFVCAFQLLCAQYLQISAFDCIGVTKSNMSRGLCKYWHGGASEKDVGSTHQIRTAFFSRNSMETKNCFTLFQCLLWILFCRTQCNSLSILNQSLGFTLAIDNSIGIFHLLVQHKIYTVFPQHFEDRCWWEQNKQNH